MNTSAETRAEAREKVNAEAMRRLVLSVIAGYPDGLTVDEIMQELGIEERNSIAPRVTELKSEGLIKTNGERRRNRRGNNEAVVIIVPRQGVLF